MTLEEALETVDARSQAAIEGVGSRGADGGGHVPAGTAMMLLSGVAAEPREVDRAVSDAAAAILTSIAGGEDPMAVLRGGLLETFVLGALVGTTDGGA